MPSIRTTVVGSFPAPGWLAGSAARPHLRDAVMVVLKAQELAGVEVISDGELARFDAGHPETNGMIDYFVRQMDGVSTWLTRADRDAFAALARAYYDRQRARGVSHHAALRQLANRLVGILHGCLKTHTCYDEATAWLGQATSARQQAA